MTYHVVSLGLHAILVTDRRVDLGEGLLVSADDLLPPGTQVL